MSSEQCGNNLAFFFLEATDIKTRDIYFYATPSHSSALVAFACHARMKWREIDLAVMPLCACGVCL
jgi:hypothetical protein